MENNQITPLCINDFFRKPKSSFIVLGLLLLYKIYVGLEKLSFNIKFSKWEKLILLLTKPSRDGRYLLNKLSYYSKSINQTYFKNKSPVEIHTVISHESLPYYVLMAKSLTYFSRILLTFFAHEDGSLTSSDVAFLKKQLPEVRLIDFKSSTDEIKKVLKNYPLLLKYRLEKNRNKINLMTTVDIPYYSQSEDIFYIDGDILFFNKPVEICRWLTNKKERSKVLYSQDHSDCYVISEKKCLDLFRTGYLEKFNMGILCYPKRLISLKSLDAFFEKIRKMGNVDRLARDQTYLMIHLQQEKQKIEVLDGNSYLVYGIDINGFVHINKRKEETICCHYTSSVRDYIYKEAIIVLFKLNNLF